MKNFSITDALKSSAKWSTLSVAVRQSSQIVITILLARYLMPEDFAVAGVVLAIVGFLSIISRAGLAEAIIATERLDKRFIDSINSFLMITGIICYLLLLVLAPYLDALYSPMYLSDIAIVAGTSILIGMWGCVPTALLQKNLDFLGLNLIAIISALIQLGFTVYLISKELGVLAIVVPQLISATVANLMACYRSGYRPWFALDFSTFKQSLPYGSSSLFSQIVNFLSSNSILLTMGRIWTPVETGLFSFVESKNLKPYELIVVSLFSNLFPIYRRISDDTRQVSLVFIRLGRLATNLIVPTYITLIVLTPELIPFLFGYQWESSVPIFQILMLVGIVRSVGFGANSIFYVLRMPSRVWHISLIRLCGYVIVIIFAWNYDLKVISVSMGVVGVEIVIGICNLFFALKALGIKLSFYFQNVWIDFIILFLFMVGMVVFSFVTDKYLQVMALKISILTFLSIFYYLLLLLIFNKSYLLNLLLKFKP